VAMVMAEAGGTNVRAGGTDVGSGGMDVGAGGTDVWVGGTDVWAGGTDVVRYLISTVTSSLAGQLIMILTLTFRPVTCSSKSTEHSCMRENDITFCNLEVVD